MTRPFARDFGSVPSGTREGPTGITVVHPGGERGGMLVLEDVAKKAWDGRLRREVQAWSTHKIRDSGQNPQSQLARAEILYDAFVKEFVWVPDPRHVERTVDPHLLFNGEFAGEDCEGLTPALLAALLASCEAIGVPTAVVAVAFDDSVDEDNPQGILSHIVGKVYDPAGKKWYFVDPTIGSLHGAPFGSVSGEGHIVREVMISVDPMRKKLCDEDVCPVDLEPPSLDEIPGMYQSLGAPMQTETIDDFGYELSTLFGEDIGPAPAPGSPGDVIGPDGYDSLNHGWLLPGDVAKLVKDLDADNERLNNSWLDAWSLDANKPGFFDDYDLWKAKYLEIYQWVRSDPSTLLRSTADQADAYRDDLVSWSNTLTTKWGGKVEGGAIAKPDTISNTIEDVTSGAKTIVKTVVLGALVVGAIVLGVRYLPVLIDSMSQRKAAA